MNRETFACFHCGARFGDAVWRDNHAQACGRLTRKRIGRPPKADPKPQTFVPTVTMPVTKEPSNIRPAAPGIAEVLLEMAREHDRLYGRNVELGPQRTPSEELANPPFRPQL